MLFDLPDPRLQGLWRPLLEPLCRPAGDPAPPVTSGLEEGWVMLALAHLGEGDRAASLLEATFTSAEFLRMEGPHHQGRAGTVLKYALAVHRLCPGRERLRALWPTLRPIAHWIAESMRTTQRLHRGKPTPGFGLMPRPAEFPEFKNPKDARGAKDGDDRLIASAGCWRGLRDAAQIAALLGEEREAKELRLWAQGGRRDVLAALALATRSEDQQRVAARVLESGVLGWRGPTVTELLRQSAAVSGATLRGLQQARLQRRDFGDYLQALLEHAGRAAVLPRAEAAVLLLSLRDLLCCEERNEEDEPTGTLWLLPAVPEAWFSAGSSFGFQDLPTIQGPISLRCVVDNDNITFTLNISGPLRCVLYYVDRAGRRRSLQHTLRTLQDPPQSGAITVVAPR